jgi:hypothetical protein
MDLLRCKTPALVHKEIWTHVLDYNLIRTVMAQAAVQHEIPPRSISFKGTLKILEAFQPFIAYQGQRGTSHEWHVEVTQGIAAKPFVTPTRRMVRSHC